MVTHLAVLTRGRLPSRFRAHNGRDQTTSVTGDRLETNSTDAPNAVFVRAGGIDRLL